MKRVHTVKLEPYLPGEYGLHQCKRRLTRIRFLDRLPPEDPEKTYRLLLPTIYEKVRRDALGPVEVNERTRAEWEPDGSGAFVLHGRGLRGFQVVVRVLNIPEADDEAVDEGSLASLHGSRLPSLT